MLKFTRILAKLRLCRLITYLARHDVRQIIANKSDSCDTCYVNHCPAVLSSSDIFLFESVDSQRRSFRTERVASPLRHLTTNIRLDRVSIQVIHQLVDECTTVGFGVLRAKAGW